MNRRRCFWSGLIAIGVLWLSLGLLFLRQVPRMTPIKAGIIEEFWERACGAVLDPESTRDAYGGGFAGPTVKEVAAGKGAYRSRGIIYGPFDGWYVYEHGHMHGSHLFRVPEADVQDSFARVIDLLSKPDNREALEPAVRKALIAWEKLPDGPERTVARFLELVQEEQLDSRKQWFKGAYELTVLAKEDVRERWMRSRNYTTAIAFEAFYLSALVLFLCWPLLRGKGRIAWALHLAVTPFLFMLPVYLGYATMSFSSAGASGGVVYPWFLTRLPSSWFPSFDHELFLAFPKFLDPLSQTTGPPMSLSWRSMPGPATVLALGCLLSVMIVFLRAYEWAARERSQLTRMAIEKRAAGKENGTSTVG
jgi:hypothetical protein